MRMNVIDFVLSTYSDLVLSSSTPLCPKPYNAGKTPRNAVRMVTSSIIVLHMCRPQTETIFTSKRKGK